MADVFSTTASKLKIMNEQHKEICAWLDDIGFKGPRNYDVNDKSIGVMWAVMRKSKERDGQVTDEIVRLEAETQNYEAKSRQLEAKLKPIWMSSERLSDLTVALSRGLARIACDLELETPSETRFIAGMSNLVENNAQLESGIEDMKDEIEILTENIEEMTNRTKHHRKVLTDLKECIRIERDAEEVSNDKQNMVQFLEAKGIQYRKSIELLEKSFATIGIDDSLKHERLTETYKSLELTQRELANLDAKLDVYQKLPPDISLAKVTVAEAKMRLAKIEEEIDKHINKNF